MYFCNDVDLMVWEPAIFGDAAFGHQMVVREAAGTLTGNALVTGAVLGNVMPGMVGQVVLSDGSLAQLLEVTAVADTSHATVSGLRARADSDLILPLVDGSVKVTVMTFRPQIAMIGDELLGLVGAVSDRDHEPSETVGEMRGFRMAAIFGTLAAILRAVSTGAGATGVDLTGSDPIVVATTVSAVTKTMLAKGDFYLKTYLALRRRIEARVNGMEKRAAIGALARE